MIFEVVLSIQRLIKKYASQLRVEWDIVLDILSELHRILDAMLSTTNSKSSNKTSNASGNVSNKTVSFSSEKQAMTQKCNDTDASQQHQIAVWSSSSTQMPLDLLKTVDMVVDCFRSGQYFGLESEFFRILDVYAEHLDHGKYSKRRCSAKCSLVIIVGIVFIASFLFYCLLFNHSFQTNPNRMTNCF